MQDVTTLIIEAQDARSRMQEAKKRIKAEVRRKYEAQIKRETAEATEDAEIEFARTLARVNAAGVSQALLRREVLRTNVWDIWTYWRDLAGMEPDRVTVNNAKKVRELANSPFLWSDDLLTLTVRKDSKGKDLAEAVEYDMTTNRKVRGKWWPESGTPEQNGLSDAERAAMKQDTAYLAYISDEIQRAIDAGNIDNPEEKG